MQGIITEDASYYRMLAVTDGNGGEVFDASTTTLAETNMHKTVLLVDTGAVHEWYNGVWYEQ